MGPFTIGQVPSSTQIFNLVNEDGTPKDLSAFSSVSLITIDPDGAEILPDAMGSVQIAGGSSGNQITLQWNSNVSPFTKAGLYQFQFELIGAGDVKDFSDLGSFVVETPVGSDIVNTWATSNDVLVITGQTVTVEQVRAAQAVIEGYIDRTYASTGTMRSRDVLWLKRAVAYQTVWQNAQFDMFTRSAPGEINQDGLIAKFTNRSSLHLAPLAERALRNISWLRSRSLRMRSTFVDGPGAPGLDPLIDDSIFVWRSM